MKPATDISTLPDALLMGGSGSAALAPLDGVDLTPETERPRGRGRLADLCELTKPRMNLLVVATTMVGYFMAAGSWSDWRLLVNTLIGTALTAAGSAVLNQYIERDYDALM